MTSKDLNLFLGGFSKKLTVRDGDPEQAEHPDLLAVTRAMTQSISDFSWEPEAANLLFVMTAFPQSEAEMEAWGLPDTHENGAARRLAGQCGEVAKRLVAGKVSVVFVDTAAAAAEGRRGGAGVRRVMEALATTFSGVFLPLETLRLATASAQPEELVRSLRRLAFGESEAVLVGAEVGRRIPVRCLARVAARDGQKSGLPEGMVITVVALRPASAISPVHLVRSDSAAVMCGPAPGQGDSHLSAFLSGLPEGHVAIVALSSGGSSSGGGGLVPGHASFPSNHAVLTAVSSCVFSLVGLVSDTLVFDRGARFGEAAVGERRGAAAAAAAAAPVVDLATALREPRDRALGLGSLGSVGEAEIVSLARAQVSVLVQKMVQDVERDKSRAGAVEVEEATWEDVLKGVAELFLFTLMEPTAKVDRFLEDTLMPALDRAKGDGYDLDDVVDVVEIPPAATAASPLGEAETKVRASYIFCVALLEKQIRAPETKKARIKEAVGEFGSAIAMLQINGEMANQPALALAVRRNYMSRLPRFFEDDQDNKPKARSFDDDEVAPQQAQPKQQQQQQQQQQQRGGGSALMKVKPVALAPVPVEKLNHFSSGLGNTKRLFRSIIVPVKAATPAASQAASKQTQPQKPEGSETQPQQPQQQPQKQQSQSQQMPPPQSMMPPPPKQPPPPSKSKAVVYHGPQVTANVPETPLRPSAKRKQAEPQKPDDDDLFVVPGSAIEETTKDKKRKLALFKRPLLQNLSSDTGHLQ